jgi:deazaflavin-dependent oxidoreductase (nitroreductase family)
MDAIIAVRAGQRETEAAMTDQEEVLDSPTGWVRKHIQEYVATNGEQGHEWRGYPTLLLTTRGRKTGKLRRTALIYGRDGNNIILVASQGGAPKHPQWYLNLTQDPQVEVQVRGEKLRGRARTATGEERRRLWDLMAKVYPPYDSYQAKTGREIPVVIVELEK